MKLKLELSLAKTEEKKVKMKRTKKTRRRKLQNSMAKKRALKGAIHHLKVIILSLQVRK